MSRKAACVHMDAPTAITSMAHNGANTHTETMRICDAKLTARLLHAMLPQPSVHFRTTVRQNLSASPLSVWLPALNLQYCRSGMDASDRDVHSGAGVQNLDEQHRSDPDTYPQKMHAELAAAMPAQVAGRQP